MSLCFICSSLPFHYRWYWLFCSLHRLSSCTFSYTGNLVVCFFFYISLFHWPVYFYILCLSINGLLLYYSHTIIRCYRYTTVLLHIPVMFINIILLLFFNLLWCILSCSDTRYFLQVNFNLETVLFESQFIVTKLTKFFSCKCGHKVCISWY